MESKLCSTVWMRLQSRSAQPETLVSRYAQLINCYMKRLQGLRVYSVTVSPCTQQREKHSSETFPKFGRCEGGLAYDNRFSWSPPAWGADPGAGARSRPTAGILGRSGLTPTGCAAAAPARPSPSPRRCRHLLCVSPFSPLHLKQFWISGCRFTKDDLESWRSFLLS